MHCTHIDASGEVLTDCGNEDFDVMVTAMLTADLSGEPEDHTVDLDGFSHEDIELRCKKCGEVLTGADADKAATVLVLKLEKRLGARLAASFTSYSFDDGTTVDHHRLKVTPLRDVTAGPAFQKAIAYREQYRRYLAQLVKRVEAADIDHRDIDVMLTTWRRDVEEHFDALLNELTA
ncbi:hypothetical protein ACFU99_05885 [Streptomyces sp. NPDC057654]|uniref:hypothetical protein n=1 Tax=Streptomyces sp. NPDC057654 TaxID=3346196 RepID=UPI00369955D3